jgi:hypothetical protein
MSRSACSERVSERAREGARERGSERAREGARERGSEGGVTEGGVRVCLCMHARELVAAWELLASLIASLIRSAATSAVRAFMSAIFSFACGRRVRYTVQRGAT